MLVLAGNLECAKPDLGRFINMAPIACILKRQEPENACEMHVQFADSQPVQEIRTLDFMIFLVFDHDSTSRGQ